MRLVVIVTTILTLLFDTNMFAFGSFAIHVVAVLQVIFHHIHFVRSQNPLALMAQSILNMLCFSFKDVSYIFDFY